MIKGSVCNHWLGDIATFVNSQIQQKEVDIKEMEMLGKFIEHAINGNAAKRQRFSDYFATLSQSGA